MSTGIHYYHQEPEKVSAQDVSSIKIGAAMPKRQGYVEEQLNAEREKILNAFMSIDVCAKTGYEAEPEELTDYIKQTTYSSGLKKFIEQNRLSEITLTDGEISYKDNIYVHILLHVLVEKPIIVHLRVSEEDVEIVRDVLAAAAEEELSETFILSRWKLTYTEYLVQVMKRERAGERILRLYGDGNAAIVYGDKKRIKAYYFNIEKNIQEMLENKISQVMEDIYTHPGFVQENEYFFVYPIHITFNIKWKYQQAYEELDKDSIYETTRYGFDEKRMEIAKDLLEIPEIKEVWERWI